MNCEHCEKEIKNMIPLVIASKIRKYLATNLAKEVKDLTLKEKKRVNERK